VTLSIIGSTEQESTLDVSKIAALSLWKSDVISRQMKVRLLLVVDLSNEKMVPFAPTMTRTDLVPLPGLEALTTNGTVFWRDCVSQEASCRSQLLVSKPARKCWNIRVSASTTDQAYSDIMPVAIKIEPTVPQSRQTLGVLDLPVDGTDKSIQVDFTS